MRNADTTSVIINPGTGTVSGNLRDARRNVSTFCRDLGFEQPLVAYKFLDRESDGRFAFRLSRGIRHAMVSMPGLPLARVKLGENDNAWDFPRLYVNGNSWLWPYALDMARSAMLDHDGTSERGYIRSKSDCDFVLAHQPRCEVCSTIIERYLDDAANQPYGYERMRCLTCNTVERVAIMTWDRSAEIVGDSWMHQRHGFVWRVTIRRMPYEALGTDDDPICALGQWYGRRCRLRQNHGGECRPKDEATFTERIDLPWREMQSGS